VTDDEITDLVISAVTEKHHYGEDEFGYLAVRATIDVLGIHDDFVVT
jgi:hypothetical protein